jgi:hypothetical protein
MQFPTIFQAHLQSYTPNDHQQSLRAFPHLTDTLPPFLLYQTLPCTLPSLPYSPHLNPWRVNRSQPV